MNFDINGLIETMEKRLGNFATNAFFAFILFAICILLLSYIINEAILPLLSALKKMSLTETSFWKTVHLLIVSFLSACGILLLYALARSRSSTSEKLEEIQKWFEESKEKLKEIPEMWDDLDRANKEFEGMNRQLSDLINKTEEYSDKLEKTF